MTLTCDNCGDEQPCPKCNQAAIRAKARKAQTDTIKAMFAAVVLLLCFTCVAMTALNW
jgi:hypothetical protein